MNGYTLTGLKHTAHTTRYRVIGRDNTDKHTGVGLTAHNAAAHEQKTEVGSGRQPGCTNDGRTENNSETLLTDGGDPVGDLCDRVEFSETRTDGGIEHSPAMQAAGRLRTIADSIERLDRQTSPDEQCVGIADGALTVTLAFDLAVDGDDHEIDLRELDSNLSVSGYSGGDD